MTTHVENKPACVASLLSDQFRRTETDSFSLLTGFTRRCGFDSLIVEASDLKTTGSVSAPLMKINDNDFEVYKGAYFI